MQNETIDKLKNAGYITVTDDSQGIADKVGVPEAFPHEFVILPDFEYTTKEITKTSGYIKVGHIDISEIDASSKILDVIKDGSLQLKGASYVPELSISVFSMVLASNGPSNLNRILDFNGNVYVKATVNGSYSIPAGTYISKNIVLFP